MTNTRYYHRQDGNVTISRRVGKHTYTERISGAEFRNRQTRNARLFAKLLFHSFFTILTFFFFILGWIGQGLSCGITLAIIMGLGWFGISKLIKKIRKEK